MVGGGGVVLGTSGLFLDPGCETLHRLPRQYSIDHQVACQCMSYYFTSML